MSYTWKILTALLILTFPYNVYAKIKNDTPNYVTIKVENIEAEIGKKDVLLIRNETKITPTKGTHILSGDLLQSSNTSIKLRASDFEISILPYKTRIIFNHILSVGEEYKDVELDCKLDLGELEISFYPNNHQGCVIIETDKKRLVLRNAKVTINEKGFLKESSGNYEVFDKVNGSWQKSSDMSILKNSNQKSPVRKESRKRLPHKNQIIAVLETDRIPREELV